MAVAIAQEKTSIEQRRQQLYDRLCQLMDSQQPYTDETLNRHKLAAMLFTNHLYVEEAIRTCSNHPSTSSFINRYRIEELKRMILRGEVATVGESVDAGFGTVATARSCFKKMEGIRLDDYMALRGAKTRVKSLN